MPWQPRSVSAVATGTTGLTVDAPAGVAEFDLIRMALVHKGADWAVMPAGWEVVGRVLQGSTRIEMHAKRATAAEPATYSVTGLANTAEGATDCYEGLIQTGPFIGAVASRGNASGAKGTGNFTNDTVNALVLGMVGMGGNVTPGTLPTLNDPNGAEQQQFFQVMASQQSATGTGCALALAASIVQIPTMLGTFSFRGPNGNQAENGAIVAAFIPEPDVLSGTFTKLYVTAKQPGTNLKGRPQGTWDQARPQNRSYYWNQFLLQPTKVNGGIVNDDEFGAGSLRTDNEKMFVQRFITPTLQAQTLSGNLDICLRVKRGDAAPATMVTRIFVYLTQGNTLTRRTTLISTTNDSTAWTQTATFRQLNAAIALPAAAVTAGDRIVVEIGVEADPFSVGVTDNFGTLAWGTTNEYNLPLADAADGGTADAAGWVEFDGGLAINDDTADPPANDACADATVIPSLPFSVAAVDTTGSLGHHRAVYYQYTPTRSGRFFVSTLGGNYSTAVRVYTGACGALTIVPSSIEAKRDHALSTSQSIAYIDATAGVTYTIEIQSYPGSVDVALDDAQWTAIDSGGSMSLRVFEQLPLQRGDLFMLSQHVTRFRDGLLFCAQSDFYGLIPSGAAIDYTGFPLDSGGSIHTGPRLLHGLFALDDVVEVLDLETLNVGESELAAFLMTGGLAIQSVQITADGAIFAGFDGDNYSWIGGLSSQSPANIRGYESLDAALAPLAPPPNEYVAELENQGTDYTVMSSDGITAWYTSAGWTIFRFDTSLNTQGADFVTLPADTGLNQGPRPGLRQLVLLPPGDGSTGLLVCAGNHVKRLDLAGDVIQIYRPPTAVVQARYQDIDKICLDPDGIHFWCADALSASLAKFVIATGDMVFETETGLPPGQVSGIQVYQVGEVPPIEPDLEAEPAGVIYPIRRLRRSPHISDENQRILHHRFQIDMEIGVGLPTGQGEDPQVMLRWSNDGGKTWSSERWKSAGAIGKYLTHVEWFRLGQGRDRVYEVVVSDPVAWRLIQAWLDTSSAEH